MRGWRWGSDAMKLAVAESKIKKGDLLLVRGSRATKVGPEIANAVAEEPCDKGRHFEVRMIQGLGARSLQAIADGPIMDPTRIYLLDGKCSVEEMKRREQ